MQKHEIRPDYIGDLMQDWPVPFTIYAAFTHYNKTAPLPLSQATFYRIFKEGIESGLFRPHPVPENQHPSYTVNLPFVAVIKAIDKVSTSLPSRMDIVRALYAPVAIADAHTKGSVTPDDVMPAQRHIATILHRIQDLRDVLARMEVLDLTDPRLTLILEESEAIRRLRNLREGFDPS